MRIPYTGHQDLSRFTHRAGTPAGEPCIQCGRRVYPVKLRVHMVNGGAEFASIDEPDDTPESEMGWQAIGPECAKTFPPHFVETFTEER
jgi:hypothetical protein